jgi:hypothetical protein
MKPSVLRDDILKYGVFACCGLCAVGCATTFYAVVVRIPALAGSRLDVLLGTIQGTALALLFAIAALLLNLTHMVYRANKRAAVGEPGERQTRPSGTGPLVEG